MRLRAHTWVVSSVLALATLAPASAQSVPLIGGPTVRDYYGIIPPLGQPKFRDYGHVVTLGGYVAPRLPSDWVVPQYVFHYEMPQPVYVPVPVVPQRPAVEQVAVTVLTLRGDAAPTETRVKPGTVVTWVNGSDRERTLEIQPASESRARSASEPGGWRLRARGGSFSLVFRQRGVYEYSLQDRPEERARIIVEE